MGFKTQSVRKWEWEWRESDWRETIPLSLGRECPRPGCRATICGGKAWRDHWAGHERSDARLEQMHEQIVILSRAVRQLAHDTGHADWYPDQPETHEEAPAVDGIVIGAGELPAEMRGGDD